MFAAGNSGPGGAASVSPPPIRRASPWGARPGGDVPRSRAAVGRRRGGRRRRRRRPERSQARSGGARAGGALRRARRGLGEPRRHLDGRPPRDRRRGAAAPGRSRPERRGDRGGPRAHGARRRAPPGRTRPAARGWSTSAPRSRRCAGRRPPPRPAGDRLRRASPGVALTYAVESGGAPVGRGSMVPPHGPRDGPLGARAGASPGGHPSSSPRRAGRRAARPAAALLGDRRPARPHRPALHAPNRPAGDRVPRERRRHGRRRGRGRSGRAPATAGPSAARRPGITPSPGRGPTGSRSRRPIGRETWHDCDAASVARRAPGPAAGLDPGLRHPVHALPGRAPAPRAQRPLRPEPLAGGVPGRQPAIHAVRGAAPPGDDPPRRDRRLQRRAPLPTSRDRHRRAALLHRDLAGRVRRGASGGSSR